MRRIHRPARIHRVLTGVLVALGAALGTAPASAQGRTTGCAEAPSTSEACLPVAARRLARGTVLSAEDIVRPAVSDPAAGGDVAAPGWIVRRVIQAGEPLRPPAVVPAPVVGGGQRVRLTVIQGAIQLTLDATAIGDASLGDSLTVRLDFSRRITGLVTGPGAVTARLPGTPP